ncbi:hypothetical protein [Raineyella fluvialis]|uniref:Uncharacterized protein n=1 Tax=Raineyella fluvialis TaxID=2662261 RepID=A0A5Q2FFK6_9ACTN|nr:hypothetical protein [Raineyella fluvialis]QGF23066.1 hypothetical protein Rai3103_04610 [Raineyella fluvialis]
MPTPASDDSIRDRLDAAVPQALRENDQPAVEAAEETIGVIESAAEAAVGPLTEAEMFAIVVAEAAARESLAAEKRAAGDTAAADRLIAQATYLREFTA